VAATEETIRDFDEEQRRPYAATSNVLAVLHRARTRNLPEVIDDDFFRLVGVPDVVFGRVRQALRFIGAILEDGRPADVFRSLAAASDEEFRTLLAGMIRDAYRDDFGRIDPSQDTQAQITNAFRRYRPRSQTSRMVMLFLGLCREAGIPLLDAPRERSMQNGQARPKTIASLPARKKDRSLPGRPEKPSTAPAPTSAPGILFGVSEADVALLDDQDFQEVWDALGKVARARARGASPAPTKPETTDSGGQI
jgi:hypothetical protein